ncbi:hypothetical protein [Streptomyces calvus]
MRPAVVPATTAAHRRRHGDAPDTAAPAVLLPPALLVPGAGPSAPPLPTRTADTGGGSRLITAAGTGAVSVTLI